MPEVLKRGMRYIPQKDTANCWLAAYQMMFSWKGRGVDEVLQILKSRTSIDLYGPADKSKDPPYPGGATVSGLDQKDWHTAARACGLWSVAGGELSDDWFKGTMKDFGPMLVHGKFELGMHSIVLIGYSASFWGTLQMVRYVNPYWTGEPVVVPRSSDIAWLRRGVSRNAGVRGVLQYWTDFNDASREKGWLVD